MTCPRSRHHASVGGPRCSRTCAMPPGPPDRCWLANGPSTAQRRPGPCEIAVSMSATRGHAALDQRVRLLPQRGLQPVRDVPGQLLAQPDRPLAERGVEGHRPRRRPRSAVFSPGTTSTSGIRCGGLNGCPTSTRSGCARAAARDRAGQQPRRARLPAPPRAGRPRRARRTARA